MRVGGVVVLLRAVRQSEIGFELRMPGKCRTVDDRCKARIINGSPNRLDSARMAFAGFRINVSLSSVRTRFVPNCATMRANNACWASQPTAAT